MCKVEDNENHVRWIYYLNCSLHGGMSEVCNNIKPTHVSYNIQTIHIPGKLGLYYRRRRVLFVCTVEDMFACSYVHAGNVSRIIVHIIIVDI